MSGNVTSRLTVADTEAERSDRVNRIARELRDRIMDRSYKVPMLPEVAAELMSLATEDDPSLMRLQKAIRQEPMIAAKVVSTANSSLYASAGSVTSLHQAAMRLGADTLQDLLSQAVAEAYVFTGRRRSSLKRLRVHSVAVAHITREACKMMNVEPGYAFLCGLFHDLGQAILLQILQENPPEGFVASDADSLVDLLHPIVGERVAKEWKLPPLVAEVARFHHCYRGSGSSSELAQMNSMVAAADRLAYHLGFGSREIGTDLHDDPIWNELQFDHEEIDTLLETAQNLGGAVAA